MVARILALSVVLLFAGSAMGQSVAIFEYELILPNGNVVPQVDLPNGERAYRIYHNRDYDIRLSVTNTGLLFTSIWAAGILPFDTPYGNLQGNAMNGGTLYAPNWFPAINTPFAASTVQGSAAAIDLGERQIIFQTPAKGPLGPTFFEGEFGTIFVEARVSPPSGIIKPAFLDVELSTFASTPSWQNEITPEDVTEDSVVAPLDALIVINELGNGNGTVPFEQPTSGRKLDVNADGSITPIDAIMVINALPST